MTEASPPSPEPADAPNPDSTASDAPALPPLRSVHTSNIPEILDHFGISVLVTTYQAGRLVMLRARDGVLNTHFRSFDKPMGLAVAENRLAVGAATSIWEFHNLPAVCAKLDAKVAEGEADSQRKHDACFLPRTTHWTGDIQIHEMAWVDSPSADSMRSKASQLELWSINTRFSCLCRRSDIYCFEPVWRPSFINSYIPGDCCHLNGLAMRDGKIRYVTALGETNEPGGWRENKKNGGILIDRDSDEVMTRGLSMPHSPRWYRDRLWVLQSGTGSIGYIDPDSGSYHCIAELPGFTRGLSFIGPLAFVGLSQVRESAVFGGIPIAERALEERTCGVWIVNIESGATIGFVKFEDAVQEIFAVEILHSRYPELVNDDRDLLAGSFELDDEMLADVPSELRSDQREPTQ